MIVKRVDSKIPGTFLLHIVDNLGDAGADVWFMYDKNSGRYIPCNEEGVELQGDHREKDWLKKVF